MLQEIIGKDYNFLKKILGEETLRRAEQEFERAIEKKVEEILKKKELEERIQKLEEIFKKDDNKHNL